MTVELTYLTWVATFTAIIWIPYILNMIMVRGLIDAVGYPENPKPLAPWATRMKAAHYNAVENLVVFGVGGSAQRCHRPCLCNLLLGAGDPPGVAHPGYSMGPDFCLCRRDRKPTNACLADSGLNNI